MKVKKLIPFCFAAAACLFTAACSIKFGFVSDESSEDSSGRLNNDDSFISEILNKGYSSTDMGEAYTLNGDFSMLELRDLDSMYEFQWLSKSDEQRYSTALNFLNFWAYYGDDASIRFKPSELVNGITDSIAISESDGEPLSVLDAALDFAVPENKDKYLALIGVIDIEEITDTAGSEESER